MKSNHFMIAVMLGIGNCSIPIMLGAQVLEATPIQSQSVQVQDAAKKPATFEAKFPSYESKFPDFYLDADYFVARGKFLDYLKTNPNSDDREYTLFMATKCLYLLGDFINFEKEVDELRVNEPNFRYLPELDLLVAHGFMRESNLVKAVEYYDKLSARYPNNSYCSSKATEHCAPIGPALSFVRSAGKKDSTNPKDQKASSLRKDSESAAATAFVMQEYRRGNNRNAIHIAKLLFEREQNQQRKISVENLLKNDELRGYSKLNVDDEITTGRLSLNVRSEIKKMSGLRAKGKHQEYRLAINKAIVQEDFSWCKDFLELNNVEQHYLAGNIDEVIVLAPQLKEDMLTDFEKDYVDIMCAVIHKEQGKDSESKALLDAIIAAPAPRSVNKSLEAIYTRAEYDLLYEVAKDVSIASGLETRDGIQAMIYQGIAALSMDPPKTEEAMLLFDQAWTACHSGAPGVDLEDSPPAATWSITHYERTDNLEGLKLWRGRVDTMLPRGTTRSVSLRRLDTSISRLEPLSKQN